jgi:hypothetical protein
MLRMIKQIRSINQVELKFPDPTDRGHCYSMYCTQQPWLIESEELKCASDLWITEFYFGTDERNIYLL